MIPRCFNDIREIERDAAADIAEVRADAAAMRAEIEALAAEARNNAWKDAILKVANVGVRVTGAVVGGIVAGPAGAAAGERIGGVLGGLVEDAGQELFHDPQNDLLAFRAGQQAARGTSPAFSPNATQRQNAADFSDHFGAGFANERQDQSEAGVDRDRPILIQIDTPVQIDREEIGRIVDEILVNRDKAGLTQGSYTRGG